MPCARLPAFAVLVAGAGLLACGADVPEAERPAADGRPSFLLLVVDTLRADAVSAYGSKPGTTTPALDALAAEGLRYARAWAPAPWTLPSHATLFTGLGPERHGVGVEGRMVLPAGLLTLAERLTVAGYETIGFSENPIVSPEVGLTRGFERFVGESTAVVLRRAGYEHARLDVVGGIEGWARQRDPSRPFFVFVNLFDPHDPYAVHPDHTVLPPGVDPERAARLGRGEPGEGVAEFAGICDRLPPPAELEILRALYRGEVAAADAELAAILEALRPAADRAPGGRLVTIVTSDHGEHFGERRLLGHEFSLHGAVLRVPLVVHGLAGTAPGVVETPVGLVDLVPTILGWAGLAVPPELPGRPLPRTSGSADTDRTLRAFWSDAPLQAPEGYRALHETDHRRRGCGPEDRVFGDLVSLVRFPFKLDGYEAHPPELHDLRWDAAERSDVSAHHPEAMAALAERAEAYRGELARAAAREREPVDPQTLETLRALGYVE